MAATPTRIALLTISAMLHAAASRPVAAAPTIELPGVVRDFRRVHPDFDVTPLDGLGHYAGNVSYTLGSGDRPVFAGGGFKVATQWTNAATEPIAPHLFVDAGNAGVIQVVDVPSVHGNATFDTWDSSVGPYGGTNVGPAPTFNIGATMPVVTPPAGLGASAGDVVLTATTLAADLHCDDLMISGLVQISGHVTVLCEGTFTMATHSDIELLPGATLDLYVMGDVLILPHANLNANPGLPALVHLYYLGTGEIRISQPNGVVYAVVIAPQGTMRVMPNAEFFGSFTGMALVVMANAGFHLDEAAQIVLDACSNILDDNAGAGPLNSDGAITSPATFDEWYSDALGTNMAWGHSITLVENGAGLYEFADDDFHPIDGMLYGNEGDAHNNYFTYAVEASFVYEACGDQFVELEGSDDIWLFIDGQLVIDLGGVAPGTEQLIELDRLGLADGQAYTAHLFFAHRRGGESRLHLRTNIDLHGVPGQRITMSWQMD